MNKKLLKQALVFLTLLVLVTPIMIATATDNYGVDKIGTYEFREITPEDTNLLNTLFVTDPDKEFPELIKIKEFAYPPRSVVLIHQGNLAQYPITDAAYTIYRTKEQ